MEAAEVIKVLTRDPWEKMVRQGGSGYWVIDPKRVGRMQYIVCVRNGEGNPRGAIDVGHGEAFLIGKIAGIELAGGERRVLIRISAFKRISVPGAWDGSQNPVRYMTLDDAMAQFGPMDVETWEDFPMPPDQPASREPSAHRTPARLTIQQAKAGLALAFGVDESCIEITIRS